MIDVVAIDGPVGVGKSSVAHKLADRFGWRHLDTGAMYRAVALKALGQGIDVADAGACTELARQIEIEFEPAPGGQKVLIDGRDATREIRSAAVTEAVSAVADHVEVRAEMTARMQKMGEAAPSVAEGRDMGTVVFPQARWKFFIDAELGERAQRRGDQLEDQGDSQDVAELQKSITARDRRDRERPVGALRVADDAVIVDTTGIGLERVVGLIEAIIRADMD